MKRITLPAGQKIAKAAPHVLGALVVAAHASEFTKVVSHASYLELGLAAILLVTWLLTRGGKTSEEEI